MRKILLLALLIMLIAYVTSDVVRDMPDYPFQGRMFSGYLSVDNPKKKLHYLFIESEKDPETAPLILWLNGGPGCSSLLGWAQEHGPASFGEESEVFELSPYSWHKLANIIYLESPAGVGFSYIDSDKPEDLAIDDEISGNENLQALVDFFRKFPTLKNNDLYVAGESYAGIYVPTLASKILDYNATQKASRQINLKGILVGNGVTDWNVDTEPALIDFAYTHALYSPETRQMYINNCVKTKNEEICNEVKEKIQNDVSKVNIYDIYRKCVSTKPTSFTLSSKSDVSYNYTPWLFSRPSKKGDKFMNYLEDSSNVFTLTPPCVDSDGPDNYFNRLDVKLALNVRPELTWGMCSEGVGERYQRNPDGSYKLYPKLIQSGIKILIYSGDTDAAVPVNGTQRWISNLKLDVVSPWRSWKTEDLNSVAGFRTIYKGLTFVTVKGTGHMVPQWKPNEAFHMLSRFLSGRDL